MEKITAQNTHEHYEIKKTFDAHTKSQDFISEYRVERLTGKQKTRQLLIDTYGADLVLMSLPTWAQVTSIGMEPIHKLIMGSGRPVLVIPEGYELKKTPQNILVGWRASAEASNAVHSALGFMQKAKNTTLMTVNKKKSICTESITDGHEIASMLDRHGANMNVWHSKLSHKSVGKQITNEAKNGSHDLIVIGAGHHGIGYNLTHGDSAKAVLKNTTVPVLLSA
ncbi:universal stress protein [Amylibacter sp. SFDW26]|uniref:universal stress protein n=1 Tax=Amylibacter sp. SFDW26 TaxID=2652722 RepID=UPI00186ABA4F|nr:universal stress protein [Amylibacter sp. SFDW26]